MKRLIVLINLIIITVASYAQIQIFKNNKDTTSSFLQDQNISIKRGSNVVVKFKGTSNQLYSISATIEILPQSFQPTRKHNKAAKRWERIEIQTPFSKNASFEIPCQRLDKYISRIIVTINGIDQKLPNNRVIEVEEGFVNGMEYSFWNGM